MGLSEAVSVSLRVVEVDVCGPAIGVEVTICMFDARFATTWPEFIIDDGSDEKSIRRTDRRGSSAGGESGSASEGGSEGVTGDSSEGAEDVETGRATMSLHAERCGRARSRSSVEMGGGRQGWYQHFLFFHSPL